MDRLVLFVLIINDILCFNVDVKNTLTFTGPSNSLFGYNGILHDSWFIVSAPKANITGYPEINSPGVVYKCHLNLAAARTGSNCVPISIQTADATAQTKQFLGGSLVECSNKILVCAHLWAKIDTQNHHNYALGRCHQINKTLQDVKSDTVFQFNSFPGSLSNAMVGFSAVKSKDPTRAILGAPGIGFTGGFITYPEVGSSFNVYAASSNGVTGAYIHQSYMGYSVASGNFDNANVCAEESVLLGMPRFVTTEGHIGSVVIVCDSQSNPSRDILVLKQLFGDEIGSGFGHSVIVADYNGDGTDDVIVSAPFHSSGIKMDTGRVYVFKGTGNSDRLVPINDTLSGGNVEFGRFGTTMTNLGDITADGLDDIAIASPYEDSGVVYIFNGMLNGMNKAYSQKIIGKNVYPGINTFGLFISQPRDTDSNGFLDFAIGSPLSDKITLFRSRPVVIVTPTFEVLPAIIPLNSSGLDCSSEGDINPCTTINLCFSFSSPGPNKVDTIELTYRVYVDTDRVTRRLPSRVYIDYNKVISKDKLQREKLPVRKGVKLCEKAFLRVGFADRQFFSAIEENLTMIINYTLTGDPTQISPVVSPGSVTSLQTQARFQTGCAGICTPDLQITTSFFPSSVILGQTNQIAVTVNLINTDEPAFAPGVTVNFSNNTKYVSFTALLDEGSVMVSCTEGEDNNTVYCSCGNQLLQQQVASFRLLFEVSRSTLQHNNENMTVIQPTVDIHTVAKIQSGLDDNHANNENFISIPVEFRSKIETDGNSLPEQAALSSKSSTLVIKHTYDIYNTGPSPMAAAGLLIQLPIYNKKEVILKYDAVQVSTDFENANCSIASVNAIGNNETRDSRYSPKEKLQNEIQNIVCPEKSTEGCMLITCQVYDLDVDVSTKIEVKLEIDTSTLQFKEVSSYHYTSRAQIFPVKTESSFQLLNNDSAQVKTELYPDKPTAKNVEPINIWIIIGAVIGGVVLLVVLGVIMYKCGFFRRKKKEQVDEFKRKSNYYEVRKTQLLDAARSKAMSKVMSRSDEVILHHK